MDIPDRIQAAQLTPRGRVACSFRLYVAGNAAASARALVNVRALCETHFPGHYRLEILDILHHEAAARLAAADRIVAVPALIRLWPKPVRRFAGDLSGLDAALEVLGIQGRHASRSMPRVF